MMAAMVGNLLIVKMLVDAGADCKQVNKVIEFYPYIESEYNLK